MADIHTTKKRRMYDVEDNVLPKKRQRVTDVVKECVSTKKDASTRLSKGQTNEGLENKFTKSNPRAFLKSTPSSEGFQKSQKKLNYSSKSSKVLANTQQISRLKDEPESDPNNTVHPLVHPGPLDALPESIDQNAHNSEDDKLRGVSSIDDEPCIVESTYRDRNTLQSGRRSRSNIAILDVTSPSIKLKKERAEIKWHFETLRKEFDHLEERVEAHDERVSLRAKKNKHNDKKDSEDEEEEEDDAYSPPVIVKKKAADEDDSDDEILLVSESSSDDSHDSYVAPSSTGEEDDSENELECFTEAYDIPSKEEMKTFTHRKLLRVAQELYDIAEDLWFRTVEDKVAAAAKALKSSVRQNVKGPKIEDLTKRPSTLKRGTLATTKPSYDFMAWVVEELEDRLQSTTNQMENAQYQYLLHRIKDLTRKNMEHYEEKILPTWKTSKNGKRREPSTYEEKMQFLLAQDPIESGAKVLNSFRRYNPVVHEEIAFALSKRERNVEAISKLAKDKGLNKNYLPEDLARCTIPTIPTFGTNKPDLGDRTRTKEFYKGHFNKLMQNLGVWVETYFAPSSRRNIPLDEDQAFCRLFTSLIKSTSYWKPETFIMRSTEFVVANASNGSDSRREKRLELYKALLYAHVYNDFFEKWIVGLKDSDKDAARTHLSLYIEDLWTPRGIRARAHYCISSLTGPTTSQYEEVLTHQLQESFNRLIDIFRPLAKYTLDPARFNNVDYKTSCEVQLYILLSESQAMARMFNMESCLYRVAWPLQSQAFNSMYMIDVQEDEKKKSRIKQLWTRATSDQLVDYSLIPGLWFVQEIVVESKEGDVVRTERRELVEEVLSHAVVAVLDV